MGDKRFLGMLMGLRRARYDLVIDVHCQMRTAFVTLVTGAPIRIGFGKPQTEIWQAAGKSLPPGTIERSWKGAREGSWLVYTHHIPLPTLDEHAVDRYLSVGRMLAIPDAPANTHLPVPAAATARVNELLQAQCLSPDKAPIVLAPAALWETKQWKPQGFVEVARHFVAAGYPVVLIGSKDERAVCREIAAKAPGTIDLAGSTSLVELAALLQRAVLCLTNDSGPMHMAVALDRPVVSVFGPTNPTWIGPYRKPEAVIRSNRPCVPCNIRWLERCPHGHACMDDVTPAQVIARMERELTIALRHS
jgi:lipopolysaccharide heptosyltransferase II